MTFFSHMGASLDGSATGRTTKSILRAPDASKRHVAVKDAWSRPFILAIAILAVTLSSAA